MTHYTQEFLCMCQHEVEPLAQLEWLESGHPTEELDIDWDTYNTLEEQGLLKFFTAREEGKLVGYAVVLSFSPLTMRGRRYSIVDAIYVDKSYRGIGKKLFGFVESCLKEDGVERLIASSSSINPIGSFLSRMNYVETETKYEKVL